MRAIEIIRAIESIPQNAGILELGAGVGAVGAVMAHNCKAEAIVSFEANPILPPQARMTHLHNGLGGTIRVEHGVILTRANVPDTIDFFVRGNFLGSALQSPDAKKSRKVQVPVFRYESIRKDFPHSVIMMDIEGGELDFLDCANLQEIDTFIAEFRPRIYGDEGVRRCLDRLV